MTWIRFGKFLNNRMFVWAKRCIDFLAVFLVGLAIAWSLGKADWLFSSQIIVPQRDNMLNAVNLMQKGKFLYQSGDASFSYAPLVALLLKLLLFCPKWLITIILVSVITFGLISTLRKCGLASWKLPVVACCLMLLAEPLRTESALGGLNILVMALIVSDLLPGSIKKSPCQVGVYLGLAVALDPIMFLFLVFLLLIGEFRKFFVSTVTFCSLSLMSLILLPKESIYYWEQIFLVPDSSAIFNPMNQTISGAFSRWIYHSLSGIFLMSGVITLLGICVAVKWWYREETVFAVAIVGLTICLTRPLSLNANYVWLVVMFCTLTLAQLLTWIKLVTQLLVFWVFTGVAPIVAVNYQSYDFTWSYAIASTATAIWGVAIIMMLTCHELSGIGPIKIYLPLRNPC